MVSNKQTKTKHKIPLLNLCNVGNVKSFASGMIPPHGQQRNINDFGVYNIDDGCPSYKD